MSDMDKKTFNNFVKKTVCSIFAPAFDKKR